ncbi:MAG: TonB-dependent receptor [Epsilonproteobacteria bacterium]|nr:TonB-dependent receptor [Campylobacterota bacterium]
MQRFWNAAVQYKATKNLTLLAKLDNIFDKFYETAEGYQTEPRTAVIGLKAKF